MLWLNHNLRASFLFMLERLGRKYRDVGGHSSKPKGDTPQRDNNTKTTDDILHRCGHAGTVSRECSFWIFKKVVSIILHFIVHNLAYFADDSQQVATRLYNLLHECRHQHDETRIPLLHTLAALSIQGCTTKSWNIRVQYAQFQHWLLLVFIFACC